MLYIAFILGPQLVGNVEPWTWNQLLAVAVVQYTYKFIMAVILTPAIYLAHNLLDNYLGKELAEEMKTQAAKWD